MADQDHLRYGPAQAPSHLYVSGGSEGPVEKDDSEGPMEKREACLMCGSPLVHPATGRPRTYCGPTCRRAAEFELRRVQSQLAMAERMEIRARAVVASTYMPQHERKAVRFWNKETLRLRSRLLELLAGSQPDEVPS